MNRGHKQTYFSPFLKTGEIFACRHSSGIWPRAKDRVLTNSKFGLFYSNFLTLTPTFSKVPIQKYGKTPNFSGNQHFYSYFQNPSENSVKTHSTSQDLCSTCVK